MLKTAFCINTNYVVDGKVNQKVSMGFVLARLMYFTAGFFIGNMVEPFDRLRVKNGQPQMDGKNTVKENGYA